MFNELNGMQLGQAIGKDRRTVTRWTKAGMPRNKDKTYCLPKVIDWLLTREKETLLADQAMAGSADSPALERYRLARAETAELDLQVKRESLIPIDDVHRQWALRVAEVAAGLEVLADRMPPLLVGKSREEMRTVIDGEVWRLRDVYSRNGKYCEIVEATD